MDNEIGTYSMILSKTQFGKSGTECPTKTIILAMHELIAVDNASTYGSSECVRIRDVRRKTVEWNYYLSVSPTSISADAGQSMHTIRITSYKKRVVDGVEESAQTAVSWDYDWNANWISPSGGPTSTSVSFYTNENTTTSTRRDNVIITQAESGKTATVSVVQDAGDVSDNYYLEVSPTTMSFGASGGTKAYTVSSYKKQVINGVEQSDSTDVGWSANVTGSGFSYTSTNVTASANSGSARTGTLKITQDESKYWEEISLSQDAQAISYDFVVTDWQKSVAAAGGTTDAIVIRSTKTENGSTTNIGWSIDSSTVPSWLTWNASSMTFTATANTGTSSREQRIYFEQNESGNRDYAMVTQAGAAAPDNYVFTWSDGTTAQKSLTPGSAATTGSYDLVSTKNGSAHLWDVSSNVSWITTEKASSTRLSYSVTANTGSSRTGIITASQSESGKTLVIQIVQASGGGSGDTYEWKIRKVSGDPWVDEITFDDVPANTAGWEGNFRIYGRKNGVQFAEYTMTSNADWLIIGDPTGGNKTYTINHNTSTTPRSGTLTLTQAESGLKTYVHFNQLGNTATEEWRYTWTLFDTDTREVLPMDYHTLSGVKAEGSEFNYSIMSYKQKYVGGVATGSKVLVPVIWPDSLSGRYTITHDTNPTTPSSYTYNTKIKIHKNLDPGYYHLSGYIIFKQSENTRNYMHGFDYSQAPYKNYIKFDKNITTPDSTYTIKYTDRSYDPPRDKEIVIGAGSVLGGYTFQYNDSSNPVVVYVSSDNTTSTSNRLDIYFIGNGGGDTYLDLAGKYTITNGSNSSAFVLEVTANSLSWRKTATFFTGKAGDLLKTVKLSFDGYNPFTIEFRAAKDGSQEVVPEAFVLNPIGRVVTSGNTTTTTLTATVPWTASIGAGTIHSSVSPTSGQAGTYTLAVSDTSTYKNQQVIVDVRKTPTSLDGAKQFVATFKH